MWNAHKLEMHYYKPFYYCKVVYQIHIIVKLSFFCYQITFPKGPYVAKNLSWKYGLVEYKKSFAHAICWKSLDEVLMFAFVSKIGLSFRR